LQQRRQRAVVGATAYSLSRVATTRTEVASALDASPLKLSVDRMVRSNSLAGRMKVVGAALLAAPDPITDIPGAALLASSYVLRRREPASLTNLALETKKLLHDIQYLRL